MESSENEQLKVLMAGFRGQNLDESDFANANVRMQLVSDLQDQGLSEALPLAYDPEAINRCGFRGLTT
jgi:aarF domain-containing kinase